MTEFLNFLELRRFFKKTDIKEVFVRDCCIRGKDNSIEPIAFKRAEFLLAPHRIYFISDTMIARFTKIKGGYVDVIDKIALVDIVSDTDRELIELN